LAEIVHADLVAVFELVGHAFLLAAAQANGQRVGLPNSAHEVVRFPAVLAALDERRTVVASGGHSDRPIHHGLVDLPESHASLLVPLYVGRDPIGVISLARVSTVPFGAAEVSIADAFSRPLALALSSNRRASALERDRGLFQEYNRRLRSELGADEAACDAMEANESAVMRDLVVRAKQLAVAGVPVLVQGERGSGKLALARAIHAWSPRARAPFLRLNCASLPASLLEAELFGDAGVDLVDARPGSLLAANGGTLLLEQLTELPASAQARLVRVLHEGVFHIAGRAAPVPVDVRIIATTPRELSASTIPGLLREDLYRRLFPVTVPPLRSRVDDIVALAERHFAQISLRTGNGPWEQSRAVRVGLESYPWPGNVRELFNAVERAALTRPAGAVNLSDFGLALPTTGYPPESGVTESATLPTFVDNERQYFERVLTVTSGKLHGADGAAAIVGLKPTTLQSRLKKLGIEPRQWKRRLRDGA
jgi:transcriptional regulator with GAF, ATPase, and Fis domain